MLKLPKIPVKKTYI